MSEQRVNPRKYRKENLQFNDKMQRKLAGILVVVVLALIALCIRIAYLDIAKGNEYAIKVLSQQGFNSRIIPYKRGDIQDRNGNIMATSVMQYNLVLDPKVIKEKKDYTDATVNALVKYMNYDSSELREGLKDREDSHYWIVTKDLKYEDIEEIQKLIDERKYELYK